MTNLYIDELSRAARLCELRAEELRNFILNSCLRHKTGRKPKNISVINITDALKRHTSVTDAAAFLGVSRGYINERVKNPTEYLAEVRK